MDNNNVTPEPTQQPSYTVTEKQVPDEIKRWNWGAFMYSVAWGIGNKTYLPLLCLIPLFNLVWIFVCGAKGNEWAWRDGNYRDVEEFMAVQRTWNRAGIFAFCLLIAIILLYILLIGFIISVISQGMSHYNQY